MAKVIVVAGPSASGKSTAYCPIDLPGAGIKIEGLNPDNTFLINTVGKELPVGGVLYTEAGLKEVDGQKKFVGNMLSSSTYKTIQQTLGVVNKNPKVKHVIMEDAQYLLSLDFLNRRQQDGYEKFAQIGYAFIMLIMETLKKMRDDIVVYLLMHTDEWKDEKEMFIKLKTIGKMLDEKFTVEGFFSSVLVATRIFKGNNLNYVFRVRPSHENDIAKTPLGMFLDKDGKLAKTIPNDLGLVDKAFRKFYKLS
jgi:hypothetical protein